MDAHRKGGCSLAGDTRAMTLKQQLDHCFKQATGFTALLHLRTDTQSTMLVVQLYILFFFQFGGTSSSLHAAATVLEISTGQENIQSFPAYTIFSHLLFEGALPSMLVTRHAPLLGIPCCLDQHCEASSPRTLYKMQKLVHFISPVPSCSHVLFYFWSLERKPV